MWGAGQILRTSVFARNTNPGKDIGPFVVQGRLSTPHFEHGFGQNLLLLFWAGAAGPNNSLMADRFVEIRGTFLSIGPDHVFPTVRDAAVSFCAAAIGPHPRRRRSVELAVQPIQQIKYSRGRRGMAKRSFVLRQHCTRSLVRLVEYHRLLAPPSRSCADPKVLRWILLHGAL
eukprot:gene15440-biopygen5195